MRTLDLLVTVAMAACIGACAGGYVASRLAKAADAADSKDPRTHVGALVRVKAAPSWGANALAPDGSDGAEWDESQCIALMQQQGLAGANGNETDDTECAAVSTSGTEQPSVIGNSNDASVAMKATLEAMLFSGRASDTEIRLLITICKEQGDRLCVDEAKEVQANRAAL